MHTEVTEVTQDTAGLPSLRAPVSLVDAKNVQSDIAVHDTPAKFSPDLSWEIP